MIVKTMTVERVPGGPVGAARIPGWVDGKTTAVIRFFGWGDKDGLPVLPMRVSAKGREFVRRFDNMRMAMGAMSAVEIYCNLRLVSAVLHLQPEPPEPWELDDPALD